MPKKSVVVMHTVVTDLWINNGMRLPKQGGHYKPVSVNSHSNQKSTVIIALIYAENFPKRFMFEYSSHDNTKFRCNEHLPIAGQITIAV
jgi:hypothetical protein